MKTLLKVCVLIGIVFSLSACDKYLDIKPKGYVIPQTVEEFERILNGIDMTKLLSDGIERLADDFYDPKIIKDENILSRDYKAYMWLPDIYTTVEDYRGYSYWDMLYRRMYQYNAVINGIDNSTGGTAIRKSTAKARGRVGRALLLYYLVNLYSKPYHELNSKTDLGVPIVTATNIETPLPDRGTVEQTFSFIIKELNESIDDLPDYAINYFEITKGAAYGFLARTHLIMGDYDKAANAATAALAFNNKLVDYNNEYTVSGDRFSVKQNSILMFSETQPESIFVHLFDYVRGMAYKNMPNETVQLFESSDIRRMNIYTDFNTGLHSYMNPVSYEYNVGISTPEMFLIRAESNARLGKIQLAMDDINNLRKNRIQTAAYQDMSASDPVDATKKVLKERRRELLFKAVRWFDIRRLHDDPIYGFTPRHYLADGTYFELEKNSPRLVLTIPDPAISDGIVQNP